MNCAFTDIASPLFKVDWPGAPASKFSPKSDKFHADFGFTQQDDVLRHSIELAKQFQTDRVRCFDFWRLEDQAPYRKRSTRNCATPRRWLQNPGSSWCWKTK